MAATIADKLYVTVQFREDARSEDGLLGFASPYTRDSAFEKRKSTQDSWAYGYGATVTIEDDENIRLELGAKSKVDATSAFIGGWHPRIVRNEPVEGFEIAKSVRRYGWSGSGNVVWRITDPRGFDLEISSDNFASIISCVDMERGRIKGKCVWGREGAKNILLPEASEPYQEAIARTKKVNSKVSLKDVKVGYLVDVLTTKVKDDETVSAYYGKMYFLSSDENEVEDPHRSRKYPGGVHSLNTKISESYVFKSVKTGKFFLIGSPKITSILATDTMTAAQVEADVNSALRNNDSYLDGMHYAVLASCTKIKPDEVAVSLKKVDVTKSDWPMIGGYSSVTYLARYQGADYITQYPNKWDRARGGSLTLISARLDLDQKTVTMDQTLRNNGSYGWYYSTVHRNSIPAPAFNEIEFFEITVTANGVSGFASHIA